MARRGRPPLPDWTKARVVELHDEGVVQWRIAEHLGISVSSVHKIIFRAELDRELDRLQHGAGT